MPNYRYFSILIYILILLLSIIICQFENESMTKALACMSVISQKFKGSEPEPSIYSTMMLKCFITISESHARKILVGLESGQNILSKRDIEKLTDYESLRDMPQNELKKKSYELEKALKSFKKMQEEITGESGGDIDPDDYDDDYDDEGFSGERPANINFFSLIPKGLSGFLNVFNSYISLFLVFAIVYFGLLMLRKINDSERKMKKKKKEKIEEDLEEEEEEYEEVDEKEIKGKKNKKNGKEKKS